MPRKHPSRLHGVIIPIVPRAQSENDHNETLEKRQHAALVGPFRETKPGRPIYHLLPFDSYIFKVNFSQKSDAKHSFQDLSSGVGQAWVHEKSLERDGSLKGVINENEQRDVYSCYQSGKDSPVPGLQMRHAKSCCGFIARFPREIRDNIFKELADMEIEDQTREVLLPNLPQHKSDRIENNLDARVFCHKLDTPMWCRYWFLNMPSRTMVSQSLSIGDPPKKATRLELACQTLFLNLKLTCRFLKADVTEYVYTFLGGFRHPDKLSDFLATMAPKTVLLEKCPQKMGTIVLDLRLIDRD